MANVTLPAALFLEGNFSKYQLRKIRSRKPVVFEALVDNELDAAVEAARTIVNVSARVDLGKIVTPGFTVVGEQKKLLIRAVGPKLADPKSSPMQNQQ